MATPGRGANAPTVRYDFFLAHAGADKAEATSLYHLLSNTRHRVFLDAETLLPGALWDIEIPRAQRQSDVTVVLISSKSEAAYYEHEEVAAAIALSREPASEHRVVPVYLARAAQQRPDIPYGLRRIHGIAEVGSLEQVAKRLTSMLRQLHECGQRDVVDRLMHDARKLFDDERYVHEARHAYSATISSLGADSRRNRATTLDEMIAELAQLCDDREPHRALFEFVLRISVRVPEFAESARQFVQDHAGRRGVADEITPQLRAESLFLLSILVDPGEKEGTPGAVQARLFLEPDGPALDRYDSTPVKSWEQLKANVDEIVLKARNFVAVSYEANPDAIRVEFLLSHAFFSQAPDEFPIKLELAKPMTLGTLHPVILRWRERLLFPGRAHVEAWKRAAEHANANPEARPTVHWIEREVCASLRAAEGRANVGKCPSQKCGGDLIWQGGSIQCPQQCGYVGSILALRFAPVDEIETESFVGAGVPYLAWLRTDPGEGNWPYFQQRLESWAYGSTLAMVPRRIHEFRKEDKVFEKLTLFWDEPPRARYYWLQEVARAGHG